MVSADSVSLGAPADIAPRLGAMVDEIHHRALVAAVERRCPDMPRTV